jgi:hypothetical protein
MLSASACSSGGDSRTGGTGGAPATGERSAPASPAQAAAVAASTNLDSTPLSAADYAMYVGIMGGASALLANLAPDDRAALDLARQVDAGQHKATIADEPLLARARALQHKDEELAELQGIGPRYRQVKEKVAAVVGAAAQPPDKDDPTARENRRFLEAHRANIERLQTVLRDPLARTSGGQ